MRSHRSEEPDRTTGPVGRRFPWRRGLLVLGLLLVVGGLSFLNSEAFFDRLRVFALETIDEQIAGDVTIERIGGSWFDRIEIEGVELRHQDESIARIASVSIEPVWRALLRRRFRLVRVEIESPHLDLAFAPDSPTNLARALAPTAPVPENLETSEPSGNDIGTVILALLEEIEIRNGRLRIDRPSLEGFEVTKIDAQVRLDSRANRFTLVYARAGTPESHVEVAGEVRPGERVRLRVDPLRIAGADLVRLGLDTHGLEALDGRIEANGPWHAVAVDADLSAPAASANLETTLDIDRLELAHVRLQADLSSTALDRTFPEAGLAGRLEMRLESEGAVGRFEGMLSPGEGRLKGTGTFDANSAPRIEAEVSFADFDPAALQPSHPERAGRLSGKGRLRLEIPPSSNARGNVAFDLEPSRLGDITFDEAVLAASGTDPAFEIETLRVRAAQGTVSVMGRVDRRPKGPLDLRGTLDVEDLRPFAALAGVAANGQLDGRFQLSGTTEAARLEGDLIAPRLQLEDEDLDLERSRLDFDLGLDLTTPMHFPRESRLSLRVDRLTTNEESARVGFDFASTGQDRPRFTVDLDVASAAIADADTDARPVDETTGDDVQSAPPIPRRLVLEAQGTYEDERILATLEQTRLETSNGTWRLRDPARMQFDRAAFSTERLVLSDERATLELTGRLGRTGTQSFEIVARELPISQIAGLLAPDRQVQAKGNLSVDLSVRGEARSPSIALDLESKNLSLSEVQLERVAARFGVAGGSAHFELSALRDASLRFGATATLPVELRWNGPLVARAAGPLDARADCDQVDLRLLEGFVEKSVTEIEGTLECDLRLAGPIDALEPSGTLSFRDFAARPAATQVLIQNGTAALELDRDRIVLRDLRAQARLGAALALPTDLVSFDKKSDRSNGVGTLQVEGAWEHRGQIALALGGGDLDFSAGGPIAGQLELDRWPIIDTRAYKLIASGGMRATGSVDAPRLEGDVRLDEGLLRPTLEFLVEGPPGRDDTIEFAATEDPLDPEETIRQKLSRAAEERDALYESLALDIGFHVERNLWIKHPEASLELRGDVQVLKRPEETLTLEGDIETERGWVRLQGRRFTLVEGKLDFAGQTPIDPFVDVLARYKVPRHSVDAHLAGRVSAPNLTLSSDPPLDQADILAVLVFGRPISELSEGEQVTVGQRATSLATAYGMTAAGRTLANALGLEAAGLHIEELSQERAAVGTYVSQNIFVSLAQQFGVEQSQELRVEYEFWPGWSIVTSANSNGTNSVDLFWKVRY